ncbi:hypothetical protein [Silanimonas sp.]|uniref:Ig-like domain-containing protein n=1 Tax=Silanimonas sp. TaxID=1929290 RepID=UPI0022BD3263|nr:hypothetical protein [Silanimonas sp.]MCZ8114597.1 hypothetical protein [Silanimonas sp.]
MARTFRPAAVLLAAFALWLAATASANPAPTSPATALAIEVREDSAALDAALAAKDAPGARAAALERLGALRGLLEVKPSQAAALLLDDARADAARAVVGDAVEARMTDVEGELAVYHFDGFERGRSWDEHVLTVDGKRYDLFGMTALRGLPNNRRVRIANAVRIDDAILALDAVEVLPRAQAKAPNLYASARIALLMVNFSDDTRTPWTKAQMESAMEDNTRWYDEVSHGKQTTTFQVFGWYTMPSPKAGCPYTRIQNEAIAAATAAGVDLSGYNIVAFAFPGIDCAWVGLGGGGNFWLNGDNGLWVVAHEVGHVLGIGHAVGFRCTNGQYADTTGCERKEYGSPFDVMGVASSGHFHPGAKTYLDYIEERTGTQRLQTVTHSGEYDVFPYATAATQVKALGIPRLGSGRMYVEYRTAFGFDASLGSRVGPHVQLTTDTNTLIDLTPATPTWDDASLGVGATYDETGTGIRVQLLSADAAKARVRIDLDPCGRTRPLVQVTDLTPNAMAGQSKRLRIDVSNADDPAQCAAATLFRLLVEPLDGTSLPAMSWSPAAEVSVAPGGSSSTELVFALPANFTDGSLRFYLDVANAARPLLKARPFRIFAVPTLRLERVSGDNQGADGGVTFAQPLRVRARDAAGAVLANQTITFTAAPGTVSATLGNGGQCTTDANGECSITATARTTPGSYLVRATARGAFGEITFHLTNHGTLIPDTTPDAFQLPGGSSASSGTDIGFGVPVVSGAARIGGINTATPVSVESGEYSLGCDGSFTATAGTLVNGTAICVRHTSAKTGNTSVTTTLVVGTLAVPFTSTTASGGASNDGGDTVPDAFAFAAQAGVPPASTVTSAPVAISGLTVPAPLSISEGTHSVGCTGTYTSAAASITNGQTVCLRHTSASRASVTTTTTLSIGGVSAEFKSTTAASPRPQTADQFDLSGAWFEPATAGQGLMVEMYTSAARGGAAPYLFAGWFTYTGTIGGVAEHDWYALEGTGTVDGRVFPLTIGRPNANVFDNGAAAGAPVQLGTATLTFSSCTEAVLDYQFNAAGGLRSGQVVLQRLLSNVSCDEATPVANAPRGFLNSGAWYEPATAGQGLLFELNPVDRQLFGAWYTFAASGPADYRWYTLQLGNIDPAATRLAAVPVFETTGGRFDRNEATSIRQVGEATIEFTGCTTGTLSYRFTVGELAGRTGDIPLSRVGPAPSECR